MRTSSLVCLFASAAVVIASCGGSTSSGTGQTTGGGGSTAAGSGGSGTAGTGTAGTSAAGSGTAGTGTAGTGAGGASPSWASCTVAGTCVLAAKGCCGSCDPTLQDVDGVYWQSTTAHQNEVCPGGAACGACPPDDGNHQGQNLLATCNGGTCQPVDVRTADMSACTQSSDCVLRYPGCCEGCGESTNLIALSTSGYSKYVAEACNPEDTSAVGCPKCATVYPAGYTAVCATDGHCHVKKPTGCPADPPQSGSLCDTSTGPLSCEYGDSVVLSCRTQATCSGGTWQVTAAKCAPLPGPGESGCPTDLTASGSACTVDGTLCDMGGGAVCACGECLGGPCSIGVKWLCREPEADCPLYAPDYGQPCSVPEQTCSYGFCGGSTGALRRCTGGVWQDELQACPL
jgi:hypothetical protein